MYLSCIPGKKYVATTIERIPTKRIFLLLNFILFEITYIAIKTNNTSVIAIPNVYLHRINYKYLVILIPY